MRLPISGSALTTHVLIHGRDSRIPIQMGNISCQRGYGGLSPNETRSVAWVPMTTGLSENLPKKGLDLQNHSSPSQPQSIVYRGRNILVIEETTKT
jgi:hypothetical protein